MSDDAIVRLVDSILSASTLAIVIVSRYLSKREHERTARHVEEAAEAAKSAYEVANHVNEKIAALKDRPQMGRKGDAE